jgi:hypothetical protein
MSNRLYPSLAWMALLFGLLTVPLAAQTPIYSEPRLDPPSVDPGVTKLRELIADAVSGSGGDLERQPVHLAVGFSTGNFARDPLSAEAARAAATTLVRTMLVRGDHLSAYAWEMNLWAHPESDPVPLPVTSDAIPDKESLQRIWPLTPQAGSRGGHDTERTIVQIAERNGHDASTVIVLLANTAASINSTGKRVIGENHPTYQATMEGWRRMPEVNPSGASVVLPYTVIPLAGPPVTRWLDAVVVVPRAFASTSLGTATRSERLAAAMAPPPVPPASSRGRNPLPLILGLLLGLGLLAAGIFYFTRRPRPAPVALRVEGEPFDLGTVPEGEEICHLAGPGYQAPTTKTVFVGEEQGAPPVKLAHFLKERGGKVRVEGDDLKLRSCDGAMVSGDCTLAAPGKHHLELEGSPSGENARVEVDVELRRAA